VRPPLPRPTALALPLTPSTVWRYLQEAGFGNAALQLSRCWLRDPESLPFARNVGPHTLIKLLQDGLLLDQLQAEATNVPLPPSSAASRVDSPRAIPTTTSAPTMAAPTPPATAPS
jgi:hypothetical protein